MIDYRGDEWLPVAQIRERVPQVSRDLLWKWSSRGAVRSYRVGRELWLSVDDVLDRERDARGADWRPGRRSRQPERGKA